MTMGILDDGNVQYLVCGAGYANLRVISYMELNTHSPPAREHVSAGKMGDLHKIGGVFQHQQPGWDATLWFCKMLTPAPVKYS